MRISWPAPATEGGSSPVPGPPPASIWDPEPIRDGLLNDIELRLANPSGPDVASVLEGLKVALSLERLDFPPLPQPALRMLELWGNIDQLRHSTVIGIVESDPALAGRVVKIANSPFFMVSTPASSLRTAVVRIGLQEVRRIILAEAVGKTFRAPGFEKELEQIRRQSMLSGWMALKLAADVGLESETCFLAGLMHDAGELATYHMVQQCGQSGLWVRDDGLFIHGNGREAMIFMAHWLHTGIGPLLAGRWNLSAETASAMAYHHAPERSETPYRTLASLIRDVDRLAELALTHFRDDRWLAWLAEGREDESMDDGIDDLPVEPIAESLDVSAKRVRQVLRSVLVRFSDDW